MGGEIVGIAPQLPPFVEHELQLTFSNDFLGRGGSVDDFRTQQFIISGRFADRWLAVLDHSILTLHSDTDPGRVDQLALSVGYQAIATGGADYRTAVAVGSGFRASGDFAGERIQNGFHRLVGSAVEDLPYTGVSRKDATLWSTAEHYRRLGAGGDGGTMGTWRVGYWLRAGALATTAGEWDGSAAAFLVLSSPAVDLWLGARGDWRSGYDEPVLRETAAAEQDLAIVAGVRWRALILETVQQLDNDASYGQLRLVASASGTPLAWSGRPKFALEAAVYLPDVESRLATRLPLSWPTSAGSRWHGAVVLGALYGESQYGNDAYLYRRSRQLDIGIDFEQPLSPGDGKLSVYWNVALGWRDEALLGDGPLEGLESEAVDRGVAVAGAGLRLEVDGKAYRWRLRTSLGLAGRLATREARVDFQGRDLRLQESSVGLTAALAVEFE